VIARIALAATLAALTLAPVTHSEALSAKPPPGIIAHESPDKKYDAGFNVRCRNGGAIVSIKEGQTSAQKCPGKGKIDRIIVKAHQDIWCRAGVAWFNLFQHGSTYLIARFQGGYLCRSVRPTSSPQPVL
jgi:hypothetical protein